MIIEFDFTILVVFDKRYALSDFRKASKVVPGSYADELVERIYDCLFKYPRDVYGEYIKYYAIEYADFADFLYWKYEIDMSASVQIRDKAKKGAYVGYGRKSIGILKDETFAAVLNQILSKLGEKVE